jgi:membrane associated rhomboid family serine protease
MNRYYRRPGFFGNFSFFPPVIKTLLVVNVAVYLLFNLILAGFSVSGMSLDVLITKYFALNPLQPVTFKDQLGSTVQFSFYPWQLVTYMFMHGGFFHLFLNMFALWMFGVELENMWGSKKFFNYYMITGIGAGLCNLLIAPLFTSVGPTVGASGAIYGILVAFGYLFPDRSIYIYGILPVKAKYLVIIYMLIEVFAVAGGSDSGIAHIAHLGGGVVGLVYLLMFNRRGSTKFFGNTGLKEKFTSYSSGAGERKGGLIPGNGSSYEPLRQKDETSKEIILTDYKKDLDDRDRDAQERLDAVLDKISESGYGSLTDEERRILQQESKRLR